MLGLSVIPLIMSALRRTERLRRPWLRAVASPAATVAVYGLLGGISGVGTTIVFVAMQSPDYLSIAALIAWFVFLIAWTVRLFR